MSRRWKDQEKRIARLLKLERVSELGKTGPDLEGDWLVVEVKDRKDLPQWLYQGLHRVRYQAGATKLGIVVITCPTAEEDYVLLSLSDWRDWFGTERKKSG